MFVEYALEIGLGLFSAISTLLMFLVKRTYNRVDKLEQGLHEHRVEDARLYITRKEHDDKIESLKSDLREMVGSIGESVRNIENYIRESNKKL